MSEDSSYPLDCPIWGTMAAEIRRDDENSRGIIYDSPRAGGRFLISAHGTNLPDNEPLLMLQSVDTSVKARLTSWLIEQRRLGEEFPEVSCDSIENAKVRHSLRVKEKADNFLRYLAELGKISDGYSFRSPGFQYYLNYFLHSLAYLESAVDILCDRNQQENGQQEIDQYLRYTDKRGWTRMVSRTLAAPTRCLTIDGNIRLEELDYIISPSSQAFIAMWFDSSMKLVRETMLSAIKNAGYEPLIIDQKHHINKIDDEIIAEIRRSRFMVADFTQDQRGSRGGVYYEAGFAHGLGIPVIFTCREDWLEKIHFDIRQYNCIRWKDNDLEKLQKDLANRITAILGDGPGRSAS